jgi:hypothetical protein
MNIHRHAFLCNAKRMSSIPFALPHCMSRVEPKEVEKQPPAREADRKPSKAEGDEKTVDEALRRQEEQQVLSAQREGPPS